jgi:death-on-curing protein
MESVARLSEEIRYPSTEQVSELYDLTIKASGGERGFVSRSNLDYLLDAVKDIGDRLPKRRAIVKKAAFLLYNVIIVHPFLNGNKRTAFGLAGALLEANGYEVPPGQKMAYEFLISIASGRVSESEVERWIARHLTELRGKSKTWPRR